MRVRSTYVAALLAAGVATGASAQVGYTPDQSPYRDARFRQMFTVFASFMKGGAGKADVGPTDIGIAGLRWDLAVGGAGTLLLGAGGGIAQRTIINPGLAPENQRITTVDQQIVLLDAGFNFNLTGRKTWRGLAPYVGAAIGMAVGSSVPEDSLGFSFRSKFQVGPLLGVRYFLNNRLHLRIEGRDVVWRLNYPDAYFRAPAADPDAPPVLDPRVNTQSDWVHNLTIGIGLGWTFRL